MGLCLDLISQLSRRGRQFCNLRFGLVECLVGVLDRLFAAACFMVVRVIGGTVSGFMHVL